MEYTIDAKNKKLGRLASEVAKILMGKDRTDFARNVLTDVKVKVINASKIDITDRKMTDKTYKMYSGYPGGLRQPNMKKIIADKGFKEVVKKAVHGMLPTNRLRPQMLKNLVIED